MRDLTPREIARLEHLAYDPKPIFAHTLEKLLGCRFQKDLCRDMSDEHLVMVTINRYAPRHYLDFFVYTITRDGGYVYGRCIGTVNGSDCALYVKLSPKVLDILEKLAHAMEEAKIPPTTIRELVEGRKVAV